MRNKACTKEAVEMDKRARNMVIATIVLFMILVVKSLWFDPVENLEGDLEKYKEYAYQTVLYERSGLLGKSGLLTYRVIDVAQESQKGATEVKYQNEINRKWNTDVLPGQYYAKVRAYVFYILPVKDITVRGGEK